MILAATEALIRIRIEPVDLFEQNIEVFYQARARDAAFGDSIVAAGFLPPNDQVVNLATGGEPPAGMLTKIRGYYRNRPAGLVILPANHNMLARQAQTALDYERIFLKRSRAPLRILEVRHRNYFFGYWATWIRGQFNTLRKTLENGGEIFVDPTLNRRYGDRPAKARARHGRAKVLGELHATADQRRTNKAKMREAFDYLNNKTGASVCLVVYPMAPSFRRAAVDHPEFAAARAWYRAEARKRGFRFVDLFGRLNDPYDFIDPTHLSERAGYRLALTILKRCRSESASRP